MENRESNVTKNQTKNQKVELTPEFFKKIDFIFNNTIKERTISETPIMKYKTYVIYLILLGLLFVLYTVYNIPKKIKYLDNKITYSLSVFDIYYENINIVDNIVCKKCHTRPNMIMSKMVLHYDDFKSFLSYVRKGGMSRNGMVMPGFSEKVISNEKLKEVYDRAKKW